MSRLTHPSRPTLFVKEGPRLAAEHERLVWLQGRLPVPEIVDFDGERLVTLGRPGAPASDRDLEPDTARAARLLAEAWRAVHALSVDDCPFDTSTDTLLARAARGAELHPDEQIWDRDRQCQRSAADVLDELHRDRPAPTATVVVHGDPAVVNALLLDGRVSGIVDVGDLGVGDRWWDISACLGSMSRPDNGLTTERRTFLDAMEVEDDPDRERWYWLLYRLRWDAPID